MNMINKMIDITVNELVKELGKELMSHKRVNVHLNYNQLKEIFNRVDERDDMLVICTYMSKAFNELMSKGIIRVFGEGCTTYLSDNILDACKYDDLYVSCSDSVILDYRSVMNNTMDVIVILGNIFDEYIEQLLIE